MNVVLIDADSKMANLALMKISQWHKQKGDRVYLKKGLDPLLPLECMRPDKIYISCVFEQNREAVLTLTQALRKRNFNVEVGGSGVDLSKELPYEIEHTCPDYTLYNIEYSIGFTSRGCIRNCPWCVVPKKEGKIRNHAPINEFYNPKWKRLLLLDNNFLASPKWYQNLREIIARKIRVSFNQGLDIRLIDEENARLLSKTRYSDDQFRRRRLYFSFDLPDLESEVLKGIHTLRRHGVRPRHIMFYVLVGFNTTFEEDMHRINLLIKEGVLPYVMPYNDRHDSYYPHLERWIDGRFYKVVTWEDYVNKKARNLLSQRSKTKSK